MDEILSAYLQYMRQPAFWWGGISMLVGTFVLLWVAGRVVAAWNTINQFFAPTKSGEKTIPSPFRRLTGCLVSLVFLLVVLVLLTLLLLNLAAG